MNSMKTQPDAILAIKSFYFWTKLLQDPTSDLIFSLVVSLFLLIIFQKHKI